MTPTAELADVVLPAASSFEFEDIGHYGLGHGVITARPHLVDPPPQCRSDMEILIELGKRTTDPGLWPDSARGLLDALLAPAGLDFPAFAERGVMHGNRRFDKYKGKGFKTPSGKVELVLSRPEALGLPPLPAPDEPPVPTPEYPLLLTTAKSPYYLHSSYRWVPALRAREPLPTVKLHPETADSLGIHTGDRVIIETTQGQIQQTAERSPDILPGVAHAAYGWWFSARETGGPADWTSANYNLLITDTPRGNAFCTPNLKGTPCRVRKANHA
jgi:anaerobic selenocysteine-containing dehydrogenase